MRIILCCWALSLGAVLAAIPGMPPQPPVRQALEAWVELRASGGTGVLSRLEVTSPRGQVEWFPERQAGGTGAVARLRLPVVPFGWTVFQAEWLPAQSGEVTVTLTSPREVSTNGLPWRQEVAWDDFRVTGMLLTNANFEHYVGNRPVAWEGGGVVNAGPLPPVEGANYARVWCERPLRQTVQVRSNVPVTLQWAARALPILGPEAMRPLSDRNTLAHQAAAYYRRGINLTRLLELPPQSPDKEECTEADFAQMKREGFDHVRLPVAWHYHAGPAPDYRLDPRFVQQVMQVASNALNQGLFVILAMRAPEAFHTQPQAHSNQWVALWRQVAAQCAEVHPGVAFELLDEPRQAVTTAWLNGLYARALELLRAHNPMRTVFLGPADGNRPEELVHLRLPAEEENVIVTVHCREPRYFTRLGLWPDEKALGQLQPLAYPGPPPAPLAVPAEASAELRQWLEAYQRRPMAQNPCSRAVVEGQLQLARDWRDFYGHPVHVGAFGAPASAGTLSRTRYYRDVRQLAEGFGLGWAAWAWQGGYHYWDRQGGRPLPGMREALFSR
ncbi:cellulase family glycosylhydrolase [Fontisphaera persica]|uniref:glycoside hydrolase family 5 protein n=1 Tax=Fontisphaera persica TaxID=2974023 RepID=UPI0024C087D1|nr:cellulase family glycosylhydrolase [Fontisphaera persica]WCJ58839.1 cellulase family glycosylhydrolase [Fontisphaera persica]